MMLELFDATRYFGSLNQKYSLTISKRVHVASIWECSECFYGKQLAF